MPALGLDFERSLRAQPAEVRRVITAALRELGFQLTAEQFSRLEARRGSKWLGGALMPARSMPIIARFDLAADGPQTAISCHLADQHLNIGGKAWGWNQTYRELFGEILARVDAGLTTLDAEAASAFAPARFWTNGGEVGFLEQAQALSTQAGAAVLGKANALLEGGRDGGPPADWKGIGSVTFAGPKGYAVLSLAETLAHLGVGVILAGQPGALPPNLTDEVERFAFKVESALGATGGQSVRVEVTAAEHPVFEFLHQQVRIRDGLPVRTLHTCQTCRFQKVTNEDFARMQLRNQRLRSLVGGVGAFVSPSGIQPFVVLGQLFRLKKLDPDYVCPRCQGMDADERVITFCPSCGDMRNEAVLRACPRCRHDLREGLPPEELWVTAEAAAALAAPPAAVGTPPSGAAPLPPPPAYPGTAPGFSAPPAPFATPQPGAWTVPPPPAIALAAPAAPGAAPAAVPAPPGPAGAGPGGAWVVPPQPGMPPMSGPRQSPTSPPEPGPAPTVGSPAIAWNVQQPAPPWSGEPGGGMVDLPEGVSFCPFCGGRVAAGYVFCPGCGGRLPAVDPSPGGSTS